MVVKKKGFYNISLRKTNIARLDSMLETKFLHFASKHNDCGPFEVQTLEN